MDRDELARAGRGALAWGVALGRPLADLLLPRACLLCARLMDPAERDLCCGVCWLGAQELPRPRCARCGHPCATALMPMRHAEGLTSTRHGDARRPAESPCHWCELLPPYVRAVRSAYALPGGTAAQVVHALKYGGWRAAARGMGRRMAALRFPPDVERERAALVPVPLAPSRLRERGYNQSAELARAIGECWGLPVLDKLLVRTRATRTQTRLTPGERSRNVSGAFHANAERATLRGLHLVLVDDVITTGATLNACAAGLHDGGARILSYVTFGRAPAVGDRW